MHVLQFTLNKKAYSNYISILILYFLKINNKLIKLHIEQSTLKTCMKVENPLHYGNLLNLVGRLMLPGRFSEKFYKPNLIG